MSLASWALRRRWINLDRTRCEIRRGVLVAVAGYALIWVGCLLAAVGLMTAGNVLLMTPIFLIVYGMICFLGEALTRRWWTAILALIMFFPILLFWIVMEFFGDFRWTTPEGKFLWWNVLDSVLAAYILFRTLRFLISVILINRLRAENRLSVREGEI